jgi:uncharacterized protein
MKRIFLALCTVFCISFSQRLEVPYLTGRVVDLAGILSQQTIQEIEARLSAHEKATSNQVAVLIIPSLQGEVLEEYSLRVAETWKLGQKEKDNGVLLLIALEDRKLRIEVGDGLEGVLTDALCSQIIRHEIVPHFKNGNYDAGLRAGVAAILGAMEGTYAASEAGGSETDAGEIVVLGGMFLLVVGTMSFLALFVPGFMGWFLYLFLMPFWLLFPLSLLGGLPWGPLPFAIFLIAFPIMRLLVQASTKSAGWQKRWTESGQASWGGWSSGGWSSGGSSFSGGGGSFSGGGSSGSW